MVGRAGSKSLRVRRATARSDWEAKTASLLTGPAERSASRSPSSVRSLAIWPAIEATCRRCISSALAAMRVSACERVIWLF
ncbi:MAG: hypothetical protein BGP06_10870 [Rhizobiales bacterium 65-9]|nr:MAG: hypothetical protein BGP06_10870 [Rhizobiales bacterium 65-9]